MRGTPGSAFPEHEPNATELPSCAPISAYRQLRKDSGGGGGGVAMRARAARAPKGQVLRHVLRHVLRVLVLHVSPKGSVGGGFKPLPFILTFRMAGSSELEEELEEAFWEPKPRRFVACRLR